MLLFGHVLQIHLYQPIPIPPQPKAGNRQPLLRLLTENLTLHSRSKHTGRSHGHTRSHTLPRSKASMAKTARSLVFQRSRLSSNSTRAGPGRFSRLGHYEVDKTKISKSGLESGMMSLSPSFHTTASLESAHSFSFSLHFGPDPSQAPGPKPPLQFSNRFLMFDAWLKQWMPASHSKAVLVLQASLAGSQFFLQREPERNEQESVPGDMETVARSPRHQCGETGWNIFTIRPSENIQMKSIIQ